MCYGRKNVNVSVVTIVGLTSNSVDLIKAFLRIHDNVVAAEVVLRYWQFAYNKKKTYKHPCTLEGLRQLLLEIERYDIVDYLNDI